MAKAYVGSDQLGKSRVFRTESYPLAGGIVAVGREGLVLLISDSLKLFVGKLLNHRLIGEAPAFLQGVGYGFNPIQRGTVINSKRTSEYLNGSYCDVESAQTTRLLEEQVRCKLISGVTFNARDRRSRSAPARAILSPHEELGQGP